MKNLYLSLLVVLVAGANATAQNVTIIESLTGNSWAVQDTVWRHVANAAGYTATIVPQNTLDDLANLYLTDILIVASGTISFTGTNHQETINQYVLSGKPVYIQAEYQPTMQGTITFGEVMDAVGADFTWNGTVSGALEPVTVLGDLSTTPNNVPTLDYFNYGMGGTASGSVQSFLQSAGADLGFIYQDPNSVYGTVITTSDEDWAWQDYSSGLMENILFALAAPINSVDGKPTTPLLVSAYPNPSSGEVVFTSSSTDMVQLTIYDAASRIVYAGRFSTNVRVDLGSLPAGVYIYEVRNEGEVVRRRIVRE